MSHYKFWDGALAVYTWHPARAEQCQRDNFSNLMNIVMYVHYIQYIIKLNTYTYIIFYYFKLLLTLSNHIITWHTTGLKWTLRKKISLMYSLIDSS